MASKTNTDVTLEYVKEHCPVFQHGRYCPYDIPCLKGLGKGCPEFKNGCPFKDVKTIEEFKTKLGQMRDECSGTDNHRKALDMFHGASGREASIYGHCPFFKTGCQLSTDENGKPILPGNYTMDYVKEHCPSFQKGKFCPYNVPEIKELAKGCPAFKDGCPFKGLKTVGEMKGKLGEMRDVHVSKGKAQVTEAFQIVHRINGKEVVKLGHCPFFKFGCPFKTDREGKPINPNGVTMEYVKSHCPSFEKGSACPYNVKGLEGLAKGCPEFKNGCPFKNVRDVGEFKVKLGEMRDSHCNAKAKEAASKANDLFHAANGEAVYKYGNCPFFKNGCCFKTDLNGKFVLPESVYMDYVKSHCPAFKKGSACPYNVKDLEGLAKGCPEFKNGCPFKNVKDVGEFRAKLGEMRDDHSNAKAKAASTKAIDLIHKANTKEAAMIGHCPFNHNHCELKNDPQGKLNA